MVVKFPLYVPVTVYCLKLKDPIGIPLITPDVRFKVKFPGNDGLISKLEYVFPIAEKVGVIDNDVFSIPVYCELGYWKSGASGTTLTLIVVVTLPVPFVAVIV